MAISSWANAIGKTPNERVLLQRAASGTQTAPSFGSYWTMVGTPVPGVAPTTAVACDRTTVGALGQQNGGALQLRVAGWQWMNTSGIIPNCAMLYDRLSHQGGLDGTVTSAQTTNLPTAALTRYTSGVGVMAAIEIYTAVGATNTTLSVSYTNQAGTAARTSPSIVIGNTAAKEAARFLILPLQSGDTGVRSVESVTLAASTTTAGNFGVTLFKPLMPIWTPAQDYLADVNPFTSLGGMSPEILDGACLALLGFGQSTTITAANMRMRFVEDDT